MRKLFRSITLVVVLLAVSSAIVAQASEAAEPPPFRGEGSAWISGYEVRDMHFLLGKESGCLILVEFDLDGPADQVQVSFDTCNGRSYPCQDMGGGHWHCPMESVEVKEVTEIRVIAVGE